MNYTIARKDWTEERGTESVVHKNDVYLSDGQLAMTTGKSCHAQVMEAVIKTLRGELQLDVESGIQYFETIFNDSRSADKWARQVREAVESLDFVKRIDGFEYSYEFHNDRLKYVLVVTTDDGQITVSEGV